MFFQFVQDDVTRRAHPCPERRVRLVSPGKCQQLVEVESFVYNPTSVQSGIVRIALLLDMCRYHQDRLTQIHRLAYRLETCRTGVCLATCHLAQELPVVQLIKRQGFVYLFHRFFFPMVPKEAQRYLRMFFVPAAHIIRKSRIDHNSEIARPFTGSCSNTS